MERKQIGRVKERKEEKAERREGISKKRGDSERQKQLGMKRGQIYRKKKKRQKEKDDNEVTK